MADPGAARRYRRLYAWLLGLYPKPFHDRFGESMEQTFRDLCRERRSEGGTLFFFVVGLYADACLGILRERTTAIMPALSRILRPAAITLVVLAIPLVAMRFTDEVDWSGFDFLAMGVLVFGAGLTFELITGRIRGSAYRAATGLALVTCFLIIWINLAVGILGSEDNPANAFYLGVLMTAGVGAACARLKPRGMARAMFAAAIVQVFVPVVALTIFRPALGAEDAVVDLVRVLFLNAFLALLFVGSAALFRQADDSRPGADPT